MEIIQPCHNKPATKVKSWREIKNDAEELRDFIRNGKFKGNLYEDAFAISHCQVSDDPKDFFVINEKLDTHPLKKLFRHWCIINLEIVKGTVPIDFKEGCMSFPFRKPKWTPRYEELKVKYKVPFMGMLITRRRHFVGVPSFICQHEAQHAKGKNIYGLK